jgi:signal transduction histidine kinase
MPPGPRSGRLRWAPFAVAAVLTTAMLGWQGVHLYDTYRQASHKESGTCVTKLAEAVYFTGRHQVDLVADLEHQLVVFGSAFGPTSLDSWRTEYAQSAQELETNLDEALTTTQGEVRSAIERVESAYTAVDRNVDHVFALIEAGAIDRAEGLMTSGEHATARTNLRLELGGLVSALDDHIARQVTLERTDELVSVSGAVVLFVAAIGAWAVFLRRIRRTEVDLAAEADRRRAAQRDLEQTQRIEALSLMAGGVAHDFENLTAVIWGSAASARANLADRERLESALARIELAAEEANDLVNSLLTFARRTPPVRTRFDLGDFVKASAALVRAVLPSGVALHVDAANDVWVEGDDTQLRQALLNIAVNGGDAMAEGGTLTLTVSTDGDGDALLSVSDTGVGMTPEVRAHIFDPFFTTREGGGGTGLGLPIAQAIVERHGGTISVESVPGIGSTFTLALPRVAAPARIERPAATILLVAVDGYATDLVAGELRRSGDAVLTAHTAADAADIWMARAVDVLVVDQSLAGVLFRPDRPSIPSVLLAGPQSDALPGVIKLQEPYTLADLRRSVDSALRLDAAGLRP